MRKIILIISIIFIPGIIFASGDSGHSLISNIGISIVAATALAYLGNLIKQPLLLTYIAAGILIGPKIGFGLVSSEKDIKDISEIGLILLLFMIGLEIDIKKLKESGKSLITTGVTQFILCVSLGIVFYYLLGYSMGNGKYDLFYLAICTGISSTTIVVKILYEKFELDTIAGRLTLGVLVFQDLWAIIILGIQPNLADPNALQILWSFGKGGILVVISLLLSKYVLGYIFKSIAKLPELVLVASLGWCFFICGIAGYFELSLEMGALIAGIAISTFPYNLDVIAKIVSLRDFFITLFFVALGMGIPDPTKDLNILAIAGISSVFLILSRYLSIFPVLYTLKNGNRISLLVPTNLAQISEFSLVIAAIGLSKGHIGQDILSIVIFIFVITSIISSYMIKFSHPLQKAMNKIIQKIGIKDINNLPQEDDSKIEKEIVILGFFRVASSLIQTINNMNKEILEKIMVVDFNPFVHQTLHSMGVKAVYGDISHMDTLHHAHLENAKLVISTIPDTILKGTDNLKLIRKIKQVSPNAKIIVTAESAARALRMYSEGADYVFLPRLLSAEHLFSYINDFLNHIDKDFKIEEIEKLKMIKDIVS
ncbi:MAG: cation:proton antiporter [Spirochaetota bacterium]|nr:cation:proton antiporter [Spirochaetota bacterium]